MLVSLKISRNSAFLGSDKHRMLFFLLVNVKMPTIVGIVTFTSRKKSCSVELSMKKDFLILGPDPVCVSANLGYKRQQIICIKYSKLFRFI